VLATDLSRRHSQALITGARILFVEREAALARVVRGTLAKNDFTVEVATSASRAQAAYIHFRPDLILLDVDHDRDAGSALIQEIRARAGLPIIVLSVRESEHDKVAMLEFGADDYLTKPVGLEELLARIRVAMRHVAPPERRSESIIRIGYLEVDLERRRVLREGELVHLTPTEYNLLGLFFAYRDKLLTDGMLLDEIWGQAKRPSAHALHVYVARLRQKLEVHPGAPRYLITEPGAGYRLATEQPAVY
jgi:two-component system, OmpR family, KDP operon response regulator KdpE